MVRMLPTLLIISFISVVTSFLSIHEMRNQCLNKIDENCETEQGVIALILARGGSKGIKHKNLAKFGNVSLLANALRVIHNCQNCFSEVWVSTDSERIAREASRYNASVHFRTLHSARDEATSFESVSEFLNGHHSIQNVALIQCTSVFIREQYLEEAVRAFTSNVDCVFAVQRSWKLRWQQIGNSNRLKAINFNIKQRPRRQDWNGELIETGMFYFVRRHLIEEHGVLQNERCKFVEIDAKHTLEIDDPFHLEVANILNRMPNW